MNTRSPIVVVLGHVDHGKTTLLDAIRKTSVASREAGGITQAIGASVIETKDGHNITFIDTPGHAAFSKMRGRGAKVADIAILVVAQDDGVQPQTKEALQIIRDAKIPFIVAGTKSDVAGVNAEALKGQLEKEQVLFEGRGGDTPFVSVSAKTDTGIKDLIDTISVLSEVSELKSDPEGILEAVVIESGKEQMGTFASVVIRNGSIKVGETIYTEEALAKVRALFNDKGISVKEILPGEPAKIIGFSEVPQVGASVTREAKEEVRETPKPKNLFDLRRLKDDEIPVIIKASNAGALEAILAALPPQIIAVDSGVGEITTSDVLNAKTGNAYIFSFESKIPSEVVKLAEAEKIKVAKFDIIYELLQAIDEILKGGKVQVLGKAEILASFPFNDKKVAGSRVTEGRISKGDILILMRGEKELGRTKATSIKKQKAEVAGVGPAEEFGVIMSPQLDFDKGDVLVSVAK